MGKRKKVAYVVIKGHQTGIFDTWPEAEQQTKGFKGGAVYAGYTTREEAERAWDQQTIYPMPGAAPAAPPPTKKKAKVAAAPTPARVPAPEPEP